MSDRSSRRIGERGSTAPAVVLLGTAILLAAAAISFQIEVPRDELLAEALPRALAMGGLASLCAALRF